MSIDHGVQFSRTFSWLQRHASSFLSVLSIPYGWAVHARGKFYDDGWLTSRRLPCPVISVGNLTVGGTGKTPMVMWLANWLRARGQRVGVLSRGYRRKSTAERLLVSDGETCLVEADEAGDEPYLIARNCPGVVVAVGKNRYDVGRWVFDQMHIDCFILDDGFQHLRLYRDCDFLLIDALDKKGIQGLLPRGRLREPVQAARRASAILVTRADQASNLTEFLLSLHSEIPKDFPSILVRFDCQFVRHVKTGESRSTEWLMGKRVVLACGIGNALSFRRTVDCLNVSIINVLEFPDHVTYTDDRIERIRKLARREKADLVLTTEKDGVKLAPYLAELEQWWAVTLEAVFEEGGEHAEDLLTRLPLNFQRHA
ncbi:MAG: tetraacyldisaccharide 4'-kinase [Nitrospirales bacterium]|nr:tetraacyldisaccharide 4'-kinase [Nitrospira sp.]MDR4502396.1 tetraacyldisaccharide 4'-kinase [Nitrospirales bacterium]